MIFIKLILLLGGESFEKIKFHNIKNPMAPVFVKQNSREVAKLNDFNTHIVFGSQKKIKVENNFHH